MDYRKQTLSYRNLLYAYHFFSFIRFSFIRLFVSHSFIRIKCVYPYQIYRLCVSNCSFMYIKFFVYLYRNISLFVSVIILDVVLTVVQLWRSKLFKKHYIKAYMLILPYNSSPDHPNYRNRINRFWTTFTKVSQL